MNAKDKLNLFWIAAAVLVGLIVVNAVGNTLTLLIIIAAVIAWAVSKGHIR